MRLTLLFSGFFLLNQSIVLCQTNPPDCPMGNNLVLSQTCAQACVVCGSLDGYSGLTLQNGQGQVFPEFCTQIVHSIKYVAFVAGSQDLTLDISVGPCTQGNSIEIGIFETLDCQSFELVSDCNTAMFTGNTYSISNTQPLVPGCHYYLVIDNNGPASCQFTIDVVNGSTGAQAPSLPQQPVGPTKLCPGSVATYTIPEVPFACAYQWTLPPGATINGQGGTVTLPHETGTSVTVQFGNTGGQICVRGVNVCLDGPASCLPVTIAPIPPTILPQQIICQGDTYEWLDGNLYNSTQLLSYTYQTPEGCDSTVSQQLKVQPTVVTNIGSIPFCEGTCIDTMGVTACSNGIYDAVFQGYLGCDSIVRFVAVMVSVAASVAPPDTLGCTLDSVILAGSGTMGPAAEWKWFSPQDTFIGSDDSIKVGKAGLYKLVISDIKFGLTCRDTTFAWVVSDTLSPVLTTTGDTLSCIKKTGQISAVASLPGVLFNWTGPNGFSSNLPSPAVQIPGVYFLSAENPANDCTAMDSVLVVADTLPLDVAAQGGVLTCAQPVILLSGSSNTPGATFNWSGPNNFSSGLPNPSTTVSGIYTLQVSAPNGCTASDTAMVTALQTPPDLSAEASGGGELTCLQTSLALVATVSDPNLIFQWSGPQGFNSNQQNPVVSQPGVYTLFVTAANGCTAGDTVVVSANNIPPDVLATGGLLTCSQPLTTLLGSSSAPGLQWQWSDGQGFTSNQQNPVVNQPGIYTLIVTATNGCTAADTAWVSQSADFPVLTATGDTLTCAEPVCQLSATSSTPGLIWAWTGPGGFMSNVQNPVVQAPGVYTVTATAVPTGCTASAQVVVIQDNTPPVLTASGDTLTCAEPLGQVSATSSTPGLIWAWTGPGGFSSNNQNASVQTAGLYVVIATAASNGCTAMAQTTVFQDDTSPALMVSGDTLTCAEPLGQVSATSSTPGLIWAWTGPGGFSSNIQNASVQTAGLYVVTATSAANGCTAMAQTTVFQDDTPPALIVSGDTLTCAAPLGQVSATSSTPGLIWAWAGPGGFSSSNQNASVQTAGLYVVTATSPANGCTASGQVTVFQDNTLPVLMVSGDTLTCAAPSGQLSASSPAPGLLWMWTGPGGFVSNVQNPSIQAPGVYVLTATTPANGCTASAQTTVFQDNTPPVLMVSGDTLTCTVPTAQLSATSSAPGLFWMWTGPGGFVSNVQNPAVQAPGMYVLTATSPANGCTASGTVIVADERQMPEVVQLADSVSLTCLNDTVSIGIQLVTAASLSWLTPQGIIEDSTNLTVFVPGEYVWTAISPGGCSVSDTIHVLDGVNPILGVDFDLQNPVCFGEFSGEIVVTHIEGGNPPYLYSFDNQLFGTGNTLTGISAGGYTLRVREAGGCEWDTVLTLSEHPEWAIWLPADSTVFRGETLLVQAQTDILPGNLSRVEWQPPISCDTCLARTTALYHDQWFVVTATDEAGCVHSDSMFVKVKQAHNVFIPNIFSPNGDGENDVFQIFSDADLELIALFRVYDRWGELLYEEKDMAPGSSHQGWDGYYRGKAATPGVYAWTAVLIFRGGTTGQYEGDVTLMR